MRRRTSGASSSSPIGDASCYNATGSRAFLSLRGCCGASISGALRDDTLVASTSVGVNGIQPVSRLSGLEDCAPMCKFLTGSVHRFDAVGGEPTQEKSVLEL